VYAKAARIALCLATALALVVLRPRPAAATSVTELIQANTFEGGPVPVLAARTVFSDGQVRFQSEDGRLHRGHLTKNELDVLRSLLASDEFHSVLDTLDAKDYEKKFFDQPAVFVKAGGISVVVPRLAETRLDLDRLVSVLRPLDRAFARVFGRRYDMSLAQHASRNKTDTSFLWGVPGASTPANERMQLTRSAMVNGRRGPRS
jgi:hypothetical protein